MVDLLVPRQQQAHRTPQAGLDRCTDGIQGNDNAALHIQHAGTEDHAVLHPERVLPGQVPIERRVIVPGKDYGPALLLSLQVGDNHRRIAVAYLPGADPVSLVSQQAADPFHCRLHDLRLPAAAGQLPKFLQKAQNFLLSVFDISRCGRQLLLLYIHPLNAPFFDTLFGRYSQYTMDFRRAYLSVFDNVIAIMNNKKTDNCLPLQQKYAIIMK